MVCSNHVKIFKILRYQELHSQKTLSLLMVLVSLNICNMQAWKTKPLAGLLMS